MNAKTENERSKIEIGHVYSAKVGGAYVSVRAEKSLGHGRYQGTTMRMEGEGSVVKFTTDAVRGDGMTEAQWREKHAPQTNDLPIPPKGPAETVKKAKKTGAPKERKLSGLDAAVRVLTEAGAPMNTGGMVKTMLEKGYWSTSGKTPAATIYAGIITEIAKKGPASRFRKTDRGHFELTDAGKDGK